MLFVLWLAATKSDRQLVWWRVAAEAHAIRAGPVLSRNQGPGVGDPRALQLWRCTTTSAKMPVYSPASQQCCPGGVLPSKQPVVLPRQCTPQQGSRAAPATTSQLHAHGSADDKTRGSLCWVCYTHVQVRPARVSVRSACITCCGSLFAAARGRNSSGAEHGVHHIPVCLHWTRPRTAHTAVITCSPSCKILSACFTLHPLPRVATYSPTV